MYPHTLSFYTWSAHYTFPHTSLTLSLIYCIVFLSYTLFIPHLIYLLFFLLFLLLLLFFLLLLLLISITYSPIPHPTTSSIITLRSPYNTQPFHILSYPPP